MSMDYFYKLEDGIDGTLYCDEESPIEIEDLVVHFSGINRFKQILINQGIDNKEESIRIQTMTINKSDIIKLKENKKFTGFFNGQVVENEKFIYISSMKFGCISFDISGCAEEELDGKIEIQMPLMIIHKCGECQIIYDANRD